MSFRDNWSSISGCERAIDALLSVLSFFSLAADLVVLDTENMVDGGVKRGWEDRRVFLAGWDRFASIISGLGGGS